MGCEIIDRAGTRTFVCSRSRSRSRSRAKRARCECGKLATLLCDGPKPNGATCNAPLCRDCATRAGDVRRLPEGALRHAHLASLAPTKHIPNDRLNLQADYRARLREHVRESAADHEDTVDYCRACAGELAR